MKKFDQKYLTREKNKCGARLEKKDWLTCVAGGETGYHGEVCGGNDRREPGEIRDQTVFRPEAPARGLGMGQHQTPRRLDCFLASTAKSIRVFGLLFQFFLCTSLLTNWHSLLLKSGILAIN